MSDVGNNLEYDHRYLELIDYFEGGNNESMVIIEETEDSDLEKQKLVRRYLDEMLKETVDLRLLTYDIVYALINDDVNSAIRSTEQLYDMSVQYWDECYPIISEDELDIRDSIFSYLMSQCTYWNKLSIVRHERLGCWSYDSWSAFSQSQGESITVSLSELIDEVEQSEVEVIYVKLMKAKDKMADLSLFLSDKLNGSSSNVLVMSEKIGNLMLGLADSWHLHSGKVQTNDINIVNDENKAIDTLTKDQSSKISNYITKNNTHKVLVEDISISNKSDAIKLLNKVSQYFKDNEPSSPVPCLLDRCIKLASKDFIGVLEDLAPESVDRIKVLFGTPSITKPQENKGEE